MRKIFLFFLLFSFAFSLETFTLRNGMRIIIVKKDTPFVFINLYYKAGSFFDPHKQEGMSYLVSRMSFLGTKRSRPWEQVFFLKRIGGGINVEVNQDYAIYSSYFPKEELPLALWYELERMKSLSLRRDKFLREREKVARQLENETRTNPWFKIYSTLLENCYRSTPYSHPPWATSEEIRKIRLPRLVNFYSTYYQPKLATLVLVGNIGQDGKELIEKMFSPITGKEIILPERVEFLARDNSVNLNINIKAKGGFVISYRISNPKLLERLSLEIVKREIERKVHEKRIKEKLGDTMSIKVDHLVYSSLISIAFTGDHSQDWGRFVQDLITKLRIIPLREEELRGIKMEILREIREKESIPYEWGKQIGELYLVFGSSEEKTLSTLLGISPTALREIVRVNLYPFDRTIIHLRSWKEK